MKKTHYILGMLAAVMLLAGCSSGSNSASNHDSGMSADMGDAMEVMEKAEVMEKVEVTESVEVAAAASTPSYEVGVMQTYSQEKFNAAVENGDKVLLDFYASWCSTCRGNAPKVEGALEASDVVGLRVDYDNAQALRAKHGVVSQSTLIVFEGGKEVKRAMGPQSNETLSELLQ